MVYHVFAQCFRHLNSLLLFANLLDVLNFEVSNGL